MHLYCCCCFWHGSTGTGTGITQGLPNPCTKLPVPYGTYGNPLISLASSQLIFIVDTPGYSTKPDIMSDRR